MPLRIAVVGVGDHSRRNHLPALADYARRHPEAVELAALCDLRRDHAAALAAQYGFRRVYDDLEAMLVGERLDGCVAVTPIPETARLARRIIQAGVPLLMEKPIGAAIAEAQSVADLAAGAGVPVMVSMNRRFDPALRTGLEWLADKPVAYLRAVMARHNRREADFFTGTAIHLIDAVRYLCGEVQSWQPQVSRVGGVAWAQVALRFSNGAAGWVEVLPTAGCLVEHYDLFGPDYRLRVRVGGVDAGEARAWENARLVLDAQPAAGEPEYIANGAYAETEAFLQALRAGAALSPSPADVLESMKLCHTLQALTPSRRRKP
jgi:predicted dehydrogenase